LLHWMLTGKAPPPGGYGNTDEIEAAGVTDPALRTALIHTLTSSRPDRQSDLKSLRRGAARGVGGAPRGRAHLPGLHPRPPAPPPEQAALVSPLRAPLEPPPDPGRKAEDRGVHDRGDRARSRGGCGAHVPPAETRAGDPGAREGRGAGDGVGPAARRGAGHG